MKFFIERTSHGPIDYPGVTPFRADDGSRNVYEIDVSTLDELMALIRSLGEIVIEPTSWLSYGNTDQPSIEVYDDYRE